MSDALKRATRSFLQGFIASLISGGIFVSIATDGTVDHKAILTAFIAAIGGGLVFLLSWAQNALEDHEIIPKVLKDSHDPALPSPVNTQGGSISEGYGSAKIVEGGDHG